MPVRGLSAPGMGILSLNLYPIRQETWFYRGIDTEYKILDNIADQLGGYLRQRNSKYPYGESGLCQLSECGWQFKAKYPSITVNILDNQGAMLRSPKKVP